MKGVENSAMFRPFIILGVAVVNGRSWSKESCMLSNGSPKEHSPWRNCPHRLSKEPES